MEQCYDIDDVIPGDSRQIPNKYENVRLVKKQPLCSLDKDESTIKLEMIEFLKQNKKLHDNFVEREDQEWLDKANEWKRINESIKDLQDIEKIIRNELIMMAQDKNISGGGIKVSKHMRKSHIDYGVIPELMGLDLEQYRKEPIEYWKIS